MPITTSEPNPALSPRARNVTAVLGPTNTGKTHLAIERMLAHPTGMIGLPLRLLAREVYDRIAARIGADKVALVTGEEKIKPEHPRFWVSTVEAMPRDIPVDFLAVDEIQLAADPERGHVFTDRLFHARGTHETLLLGAATMRDAIRELLPGANFVSRPRLSKLSYAGQKKISRLPRRSAIVAFSQAEVYEIAELLRRQRGGAAVVLGALSPRTRNAQVALYQSGDVDYLVATDAIGMGLNLDLDHVAFAQARKFDGHNYRNLTPGEIGQIAGRAGRHLRDGTFGVTGEVEPFESDLIERLEKHEFEPVKVLQWRNAALDYSSLDNLKESLRVVPSHPRLTRARVADDVEALEIVSRDTEITDLARGARAVERLWDVCQVPDYRKLSSSSHSELVASLYKFLAPDRGRIPEDWFSEQVARSSKTDGDIDTIANRISHIRTCTFIANRSDWLEHPEHWQGKTREIEDLLSDALHELLTQRFVDQRTSVLMKRLRDDEELSAEIADDGAIHVEKHYVGRLKGFQFAIDSAAEGLEGKAARQAAAQVLGKELGMRARRVTSAKADAFKLTRLGRIEWRGETIGRLERSDDPLKPQVILLADEHLVSPDRERVQERLQTFVNELIEERLKPLVELSRAEDVTGMARGIAFRMKESFGVLRRDGVSEEVRGLDQEARAQLRRYGVRFGAFNLYFPILLKPAACELLLILSALSRTERGGNGIESSSEPPRPGLTSVPFDPAAQEDTLRIAGFQPCGPRAVRIDMLERLADMIRPLTAWRASETSPASPPKGATGDGGFTVVPEMMSILGCSQGELGEVLKALGFWCERKPAPPKPVPAKVEAAAPEVAANISAPPAETMASEPAAAPSEPVAEVVQPDVPAEAAALEPVAVAAVDEAAPPAEPEMIEVWRPRRRRQEGDRRWQGKRERTEGGDTGERRPHHGRRRDRDHRNRHRGPGQTPAQTGDAAAAAPAVTVTPSVHGTGGSAATPAEATAAPAAEQRPPRDRPRHEHRRHGNKHKGGDREHHGKHRQGDGQRSEHRDRGRDNRPPREERRQSYDPDSPFAKLAALKSELEGRQKEQTSS